MNAAEFENALSDPARFASLCELYPLGTFCEHDTAYLLNSVVAELSFAIGELDVRYHPRIRLTRPQRRGTAIERALMLTLGKKKRRIPISVVPKFIFVRDQMIAVNNSGGPMRLVARLVGEIARFWNDFHKSIAERKTDDALLAAFE